MFKCTWLGTLKNRLWEKKNLKHNVFWNWITIFSKFVVQLLIILKLITKKYHQFFWLIKFKEVVNFRYELCISNIFKIWKFQLGQLILLVGQIIFLCTQIILLNPRVLFFKRTNNITLLLNIIIFHFYYIQITSCENNLKRKEPDLMQQQNHNCGNKNFSLLIYGTLTKRTTVSCNILIINSSNNNSNNNNNPLANAPSMRVCASVLAPPRYC